MKKGATCVAPFLAACRRLLLVTQRPDVRRDLIDLIISDVGTTPRRHRNPALRLLLSYALLDIGGDAGIAAVAMKPGVIHQVRRRPEHPFCVLTVASVTIPGARKNGLALVHHLLGDAARKSLRSRRRGGGEEGEGEEQ